MKIISKIRYSMPSIILLLFVVGCSKIKKGNQRLGSEKAIGVFNGAYIDDEDKGYVSDSYDDILKVAKNSYILLEPFDDITSDQISALKVKDNEVGAYISIGTVEGWRHDFSQLIPYAVDIEWDEWPNEYFVTETATGIIDIMKIRIDSIATLGYDWVEFDNMDWTTDSSYRANTGFSTTNEEAEIYYNELCDYVHSNGMKCMAKNTVNEAENFDGVLYESEIDNSEKKELDWWDSAGAQSFLEQGKTVIINHYNCSNCNKVYKEYMSLYNEDISFICSGKFSKKYIHYNL